MKLTKKQNNKSPFKSFLKNQIFIDTILSIILLLIMLLIISNPTKYTSGTISGLKLFFTAVLPGLFPFMLITKILTEIGLVFNLSKKCDKFTQKVFGTPGVSLYAFFMSIISGYPIGAKIIGDLYEKKLISDSDAKKMSIFCTTSGPIFIIGTVGTFMFKSFTFGIILYASHILSSLLLGIICNLFWRKKVATIAYPEIVSRPKSKDIISSSISQTINSLFVVGAYITIFYLIAEIFESLNVFSALQMVLSPILSSIGLDTKYLQGVLYGILEVTRGAQTLSVFNSHSSLILTSGILSFSGLSIIFQSMAFLKPAGVKTTQFVIFKILHALLAMLLCFLLLLLI